MSHRIPLRAFFKITRSPQSFEEARKIYSFFASKGEILEFKFARDSDIKKVKDFGWISYKDSKITEQLFESWIKIEPYDIEAIIHRSEQKAKDQLPINKQQRILPPMFGGFYLKDDKLSSSSILDQTNKNSLKNVQIGDTIILEESIEDILETSETSGNQKESTNYTENTIIESTATSTEVRVESQ
ncbi:unnamed protein product [Rhizophagus irregularis]|uniref:RRM domain-containing protein n=1 Tax=Rhizophagus irregularis TaxID=588596 RepID=A0A2N1NM98_9GLOM|nr:hypothetical protein RhiirC2_264539 [Rhizophagus irregularis]CAB4391897.1 unnamed protein product [Rhizophagus irregularis]CAB5395236.1 unnamed protein product [Rhizophagus irregularis]CAB5396135.1 unnamed protein product [Rhizophagus irregularis]